MRLVRFELTRREAPPPQDGVSAVPPQPHFFFGAGGRTRTDTKLPPADFESATSANYVTPAYWWRGLDSNQRRQSRQIYSLIPLATREPLHLELVIGIEPTTC